MSEAVWRRTRTRLDTIPERLAVIDGQGRQWTYGDLSAAVGAQPLVSTPRFLLVPRRDLTTFARLLAGWEQSRSAVILHSHLTAAQRARVLRVAIGTDSQPPCVLSSPDEMLVALSSGTSGHPKLIARDHESWARTLERSDELWPVGVGETIWCPGPLDSTHFLYGALHALASGATVDLRSLENAEEIHPSVVYTNPTIAARLSDSTRALPRSIRLVLSTGATWEVSARATFEGRLPGHADTAHFYGASELSFVSYTSRADTADVRAGRPIPGVRVAVLDKDGRIAGTDQIGDIHISSDMLFSGYLTERGVTGRPINSTATVHDRGYLDNDGRLHLAGRASRMFTRAGLNVEPNTIEAALLRHPLVTAAACIPRPDPTLGGVPVAAVVATGVTTRELRSWCARHLDPAHRPREIHLMTTLPATHRGKPDFEQIKRLLG